MRLTRDDACRLGGVEHVDRAAAGDAGERRDHVEAPVLVDDRVDRRGDRGLVGDVDAWKSPAAPSTRSTSRPTTRAPSSANRGAVASPSPDAAPVTSATLPSKSPHSTTYAPT